MADLPPRPLAICRLRGDERRYGWRVANGAKWRDCICNDCRGGVPLEVKFFLSEQDAEYEAVWQIHDLMQPTR